MGGGLFEEGINYGIVLVMDIVGIAITIRIIENLNLFKNIHTIKHKKIEDKAETSCHLYE